MARSLDTVVSAIVTETRCPNCGEQHNYGFSSDTGAKCRTCGHAWWPPPPYAQPEDESDDCNSTAECPASDSHYKGCPVLDLPKWQR